MNMNLQPIWKRLPLLAWGTVVAAATVALALEHSGTKPAGEADDAKPKAVSLTVDEKPIDRAGRFSASFAPVVKKVSPSVVKVFTAVA